MADNFNIIKQDKDGLTIRNNETGANQIISKDSPFYAIYLKGVKPALPVEESKPPVAQPTATNDVSEQQTARYAQVAGSPTKDETMRQQILGKAKKPDLISSFPKDTPWIPLERLGYGKDLNGFINPTDLSTEEKQWLIDQHERQNQQPAPEQGDK